MLVRKGRVMFLCGHSDYRKVQCSCPSYHTFAYNLCAVFLFPSPEDFVASNKYTETSKEYITFSKVFSRIYPRTCGVKNSYLRNFRFNKTIFDTNPVLPIEQTGLIENTFDFPKRLVRFKLSGEILNLIDKE